MSRQLNAVKLQEAVGQTQQLFLFAGQSQTAKLLFFFLQILKRFKVKTAPAERYRDSQKYSCSIRVEVSVKWSAVSLWRPPAGRRGGTVVCADVNQALAGLEAGQRLTALEGGQGPTEAHHGGGVVLV